MPDQVLELQGVKVLVCAAEGPSLASERDAPDFISKGWAAGVTWIAVPRSRLGEGFLRLETRLAGEILQKFVTYDMRLVILGDLSAEVAASKALHDFVYESNRGRHVWFVNDLAELERRLTA